MTTVFLAMLACLVSVSLGNSVERIGAHRRPHNPALSNSQDRNLFIPLPMVRNVRMQPDDHGHYELDVETADGARRTEVGNMDDDGNNEVKGVIKYILPDGTPFVLRYIADETGFHPQGNMLPTPPPMPAHSMLQMKRAGMLHDSLEDDSMFDSMENDPMFKSMEDMFRSLEDDLIDDSLEISTLKHIHPVTGQIANHPVTGQIANHPVTGQVVRFDSIEDRFDSIEDRFDSIENRRVLTRNRGNVRGLLKNRANRRGVLLRNRKTGNIVLYKNGRIIDSIENDGFRSLEDNTFEDLSLEDNTFESLSLEDNTLENDTLEDITFEDISLENRTDERNSFEDNSRENDSLEYIVKLNQSVSNARRRFLTRG